MPRTDENGKELQVVLTYLTGRVIPVGELHTALGVSRNTYTTRSQADDFPNAEECRLVAEAYGLNPIGMQIRFGLATQTQVDNLVSNTPLRQGATVTNLPQTPKMHAEPRADRPPI
jgi:hypothetical protein